MVRKIALILGFLAFSSLAYDLENLINLEEKCNMGVSDACFSAALVYDFEGEYSDDPQKAFNLYKKGCELNDKSSCLNAGVMIDSGRGVRQSYDIANQFFKKSCLLGEGSACFYLATNYEEKLGSAIASEKIILMYYKKAYELSKNDCLVNDSGYDCDSLGKQYEFGCGVNKSLNLALKFYGKACDLGFNEGCEHYKNLIN